MPTCHWACDQPGSTHPKRCPSMCGVWRSTVFSTLASAPNSSATFPPATLMAWSDRARPPRGSSKSPLAGGLETPCASLVGRIFLPVRRASLSPGGVAGNDAKIHPRGALIIEPASPLLQSAQELPPSTQPFSAGFLCPSRQRVARDLAPHGGPGISVHGTSPPPASDRASTVISPLRCAPQHSTADQSVRLRYDRRVHLAISIRPEPSISSSCPWTSACHRDQAVTAYSHAGSFWQAPLWVPGDRHPPACQPYPRQPEPQPDQAV